MAATTGIVGASRRAGQRGHGRCSGFTILEILIAITILVIVMGIVYTMFSSVSGSVDNLRSKRPEIQQINFLLRRLTENLAAAYLVYDLTNQAVFFVGEDKQSDEREDGEEGVAPHLARDARLAAHADLGRFNAHRSPAVRAAGSGPARATTSSGRAPPRAPPPCPGRCSAPCR